MEITSVSRRYGGALHGFAAESGASDAVRADCADILRLIEGSAELAAFVADPTIPPREAEKALAALFEERVDPTTSRFLRFLVSRRRLDQLPAACAVYEELTREKLGVIKVNITSAHALTDAQLAAMKEKLAAQYEKQIDAETKVDPALIGGFTIQVGDHIRDFSLATKLDGFEQRVLNAKHQHPKLEG